MLRDLGKIAMINLGLGRPLDNPTVVQWTTAWVYRGTPTQGKPTSVGPVTLLDRNREYVLVGLLAGRYFPHPEGLGI